MAGLLEETSYPAGWEHYQDDEQQPYRFLRNDLVELRRLESTRVALVFQGAERLQSAALVELQPVVDGAWTDAEEYSGPRKLDHQLSYSGGPGKG